MIQPCPRPTRSAHGQAETEATPVQWSPVCGPDYGAERWQSAGPTGERQLEPGLGPGATRLDREAAVRPRITDLAPAVPAAAPADSRSTAVGPPS
ncbi:hypothetical protein GCM10023100_10490 [Actinocorallia cavernae]|uniref:Uncharacterized protein n=2 Tax=Actinomycetes TaxID=1760 RepID=A0ABN3M4S9_9ACTN